MGLSIGKVRVGLLVGAGLLVAVVLGFIGYAHFVAARFVKGLPGRLGVDIKQTTDNFTYSQSLKGKTVFTIHAAKAIQHNDSKVTLRDVGIVLYGREGNRADHIYGDEFEYDQKLGVATASGEVRIDLQAPAAAFHGKPDGGVHETGEAADGKDDDKDARVVHVKTRGLVFHQKEGFATTPEQIDFTSGGMTGHALGAQYNSQTGVIVLDSAVHVSGLMQERPGVLTASHAEMDQRANTAVFTGAKYVSPGQGLEADHAVVHTTRDGTPQAMEAQGHVRVTGQDRGAVMSDRMDVVLNAKGKLESSHLYGGVRYADASDGRDAQGNAADARVCFDGDGRAKHVDLTGGVTGEDRGTAAVRTMSAQRLVLELEPQGTRSVLRDAVATGAAKVREVAQSAGKGAATTEMAGDTLTAHFDAVNGESRISTVHGAGHTALHQVARDGTDETSSGDTLEMLFRPVVAGKVTKARAGLQTGGQQPVEVQRAVQRGGVKVVRRLPARAGAAASTAEVQRAAGDEEIYDGDADRVTLRGRAQVEDPSGAVYAETVTMERQSGDATAEGGVRTTYLQASGGGTQKTEPTHVLADHANFKRGLGMAYFYGVVARPARLWQGGSQVEAPVLEFVQADKRLKAYGEGSGDAAVVHGVLLGSSARPAGDKAAAKGSQLVHVASRELAYSDVLRQVELKGRVRVEDADGVMLSDHATVYLSPSQAPSATNGGGGASNKPPADAFLGGQVERVVATGAVRVEQPGRLAEGQQLVYTAVDKTFVMTGTRAAPPRIVSEGRDNESPGTVVGTSLRFRSGDDSVLILGGDGQSGAQRVKTETRVKK